MPTKRVSDKSILTFEPKGIWATILSIFKMPKKFAIPFTFIS